MSCTSWDTDIEISIVKRRGWAAGLRFLFHFWSLKKAEKRDVNILPFVIVLSKWKLSIFCIDIDNKDIIDILFSFTKK